MAAGASAAALRCCPAHLSNPPTESSPAVVAVVFAAECAAVSVTFASTGVHAAQAAAPAPASETANFVLTARMAGIAMLRRDF